MKSIFFKIIKIYTIALLILLVLTSIYTLYLMKANVIKINPIFILIIGAITFFFLGLLFANYFHKKGLLVGLLNGVIHILIISLFIFLSGNEFDNLFYLKYLLFIIASTIGGIMGVNFKKII